MDLPAVAVTPGTPLSAVTRFERPVAAGSVTVHAAAPLCDHDHVAVVTHGSHAAGHVDLVAHPGCADSISGLYGGAAVVPAAVCHAAQVHVLATTADGHIVLTRATSGRRRPWSASLEVALPARGTLADVVAADAARFGTSADGAALLAVARSHDLQTGSPTGVALFAHVRLATTSLQLVQRRSSDCEVRVAAVGELPGLRLRAPGGAPWHPTALFRLALLAG